MQRVTLEKLLPRSTKSAKVDGILISKRQLSPPVKKYEIDQQVSGDDGYPEDAIDDEYDDEEHGILKLISSSQPSPKQSLIRLPQKVISQSQTNFNFFQETDQPESAAAISTEQVQYQKRTQSSPGFAAVNVSLRKQNESPSYQAHLSSMDNNNVCGRMVGQSTSLFTLGGEQPPPRLMQIPSSFNKLIEEQ